VTSGDLGKVRTMEPADCWCILRTSAGRTLSLTRALAGAGFEVWAPARTVSVRRPRSHKRVLREVSILPTFVFARGDSGLDLLRASVMEPCPFPPFSVFRRRGEIPMIRDAEIEQLREVEARMRRRDPKPSASALAVGARVKAQAGGFQGLVGMVRHSDEKSTTVDFGGWLGRVQVATFLVIPDGVSAPQPGGSGTTV